ncbi:protein MCM10 homolog isoform X3 [Parasteatoda tepidariorum]|uniref:protein MCM10 homolog isoform X3 n=1 Tax=Parasteatoda tepidariorum TaxID=114398 RepID=UPI001C71B95F|nr:protein MCM10 homolog isoform X3 [Parasteatoda tepidariorum]
MDDFEDLDLDSLMELLDDDTSVPSEKQPFKEGKSLEVESKEVPTVKSVSRVLKDVPLEFPSEATNSVYISTKSKIDSLGNDSMDDESEAYLSKEGKELQSIISEASKNSGKSFFASANQKRSLTWKDSAKMNKNNSKSAEKCYTDSYSGIRIVDPLISFDMMQKRMEGRRLIKMSFIKNFIKGGDIEGDWVTVGILISKLPPKTSKSGKNFSIWKMSDLHDCEKVVTMFLFGAAHAEHWKMTVGTVIGFLNPSLMPDNKDKNGNMTLSIDHAGKLMQMGKSKDFGHCKGRRKDGTTCTVPVNVSQCEYCVFHVKREYQKFSAKRSELQASYSGREPSLKNKILKKQNIIYGGQMFTPAEKNNQLALPTVGSRNLLQHIIKEKAKKEGENVKEVTTKDLLKMRDSYKNIRSPNQRQNDSMIMKNLVPELGRGLQPGQSVSLDFSLSKRPKFCSVQDLAKLKAIQKIQDKGPIKRQDPNSVKTSADISMKVQAALNKSIDEHNDYVGDDEEIDIPKSQLGEIDINSEKIKAILNRKSSHAYEVEVAEIEKQESYFSALEKKEQMEEKMASTTEVVCDVVSCKQCKYTAHHATDRCKDRRHPLKRHKAIKRFFVCKDCKNRSCCFTKLPKRPCRNCGGSNYERTSMIKLRAGPKLDSETLKIRGDEIKFLN